MNIKAANATDVLCYGVFPIKVKIEQFEMINDFYIIKDSVIPIIGRDFMRRHDVRHRMAKDRIYGGETEIPGYTMKGTKVKRVCFCKTFICTSVRQRSRHTRTSSWMCSRRSYCSINSCLNYFSTYRVTSL